MELNKNSIAKLSTVHKDLQKVIYRAAEITTIKFIVTYGIRTLEEQRKFYEAGKSKTMKSRHLDGLAVDLAPWVDDDSDGVVDNGEVKWSNEMLAVIAKTVEQAAKEVGVPIEWGGDWKGWKDRPHFQLPSKQYPGKWS